MESVNISDNISLRQEDMYPASPLPAIPSAENPISNGDVSKRRGGGLPKHQT